jgi:hypothetical protein
MNGITLQEVLAQRESRRALQSQKKHIVHIQAYIRMWITRKKYLEMRAAARYAAGAWICTSTDGAASSHSQSCMHAAFCCVAEPGQELHTR